MKPTPEQWEQIAEELHNVWGHVKLLADGHTVDIFLKRSRMNLRLFVYVDGYIKGEWTQGGEEARRFWRPNVRRLWSKKEAEEGKKLLRGCGKEYRKERLAEYEKTFTIYTPDWGSFRALKSHLVKQNDNIEILEIGQIRFASASSAVKEGSK